MLATLLFADVARGGPTRRTAPRVAAASAARSSRASADGRDAARSRDLRRPRPRRPLRLGDRRLRADLGADARAGVHTGEIERAAPTGTGSPSASARAIAAAARPGEVLVSSTVKDIVAGSGIGFEERGEHELAGAPGTWRLFAAA